MFSLNKNSSLIGSKVMPEELTIAYTVAGSQAILRLYILEEQILELVPE